VICAVCHKGIAPFDEAGQSFTLDDVFHPWCCPVCKLPDLGAAPERGPLRRLWHRVRR
jgi:endogenous inhibitor of DNA gyrase (YacG/DUF329 family)